MDLLRWGAMGHALASRPYGVQNADHECVVLLVDDDEGFRSALAEHLRDDGYAVIEYAAAQDVPAFGGLGEVHVVVTDYDMPGTDGLSFADRFHAVHPRVPIIMVSGSCSTHLQTQAAARGFVALLPKPFQYDSLHRLLPQLSH
ncbi:MAG: two component, sigma54 specific, transcriptional regulator, Fis family [Deltaproteobacteria bacterium]|nr:two component, sigma54 specific, transcriptional regulator, Fis family [Deltaproteobacteria bacterium]